MILYPEQPNYLSALVLNSNDPCHPTREIVFFLLPFLSRIIQASVAYQCPYVSSLQPKCLLSTFILKSRLSLSLNLAPSVGRLDSGSKPPRLVKRERLNEL